MCRSRLTGVGIRNFLGISKAGCLINFAGRNLQGKPCFWRLIGVLKIMGVSSKLRWTCEQCGNKFARKRTGKKPIRFCSLRCRDLYVSKHPNKTAFKKGALPWNKGIKGTHFSPKTEFKKGNIPPNYFPVGETRIRIDKNGKPRAFVKISDPNSWKSRAVLVWESHKGPVPKGKIIHHKDRNTLNDIIENLDIESRAEHLSEHRKEFSDKAILALSVFWKNNPDKNIARIANSLRTRFGEESAKKYLSRFKK